MPDYVVAKPFNTAIQRFSVGAVVRLTDELSPRSFADLKDRGFIEPSRIDFESMTKAELESLAADRNVDISAAQTKADIIAALQYADKRDETIQADNFDALLKADLERLAAERGLDVSGSKTKADLIALLQSQPRGVTASPVAAEV